MAAHPDDEAPRSDDAADEEPASRTGRFHVEHRGGTRVEVGEPVSVGGERPWMCAVKLLGRKREDTLDGDPTRTLLIRTGRGATPEDARRNALAQLTLVYGSPVEPPPAAVILEKSPEPAVPPEPKVERRDTWLRRLIGRLRGP